jgi:BMFP domain-containing protein YqiC
VERQDFLGDLQSRITELLRASPVGDIERNLKALLNQAFQKLELISREEFDVQRDILARTRDRLAELEKRLAEVEAQQRPH